MLLMSSRGRAWKKQNQNLSNAYWLRFNRKIRAQKGLAGLKAEKAEKLPGRS